MVTSTPNKLHACISTTIHTYHWSCLYMYYYLVGICNNPVNFQEHLAQLASEKEGVSEKTRAFWAIIGESKNQS